LALAEIKKLYLAKAKKSYIAPQPLAEASGNWSKLILLLNGSSLVNRK